MAEQRKKNPPKQRAQGEVNSYVVGKLRELRLAQGLTCQQMAWRIGISAGSYSGLENGWYRINLDNLFAVLKVLGVGLQDVWPSGNGFHGTEPSRKESLDQFVKRSTKRPAVRLSDVLEAAAEAFSVPQHKMASPSRWSRLQEARAACAVLVREIPGLRLRSLARLLNRNETALGQLERRFRQQAKEDGELSARIESARRILRERQGADGQPLGVRRLS